MKIAAEVVANTGWTWEEAEALPLSRLFALYDTWAEYPPVRISMAIMAGTVNVKNEGPCDFGELTGVMPVVRLSNDAFAEMLKSWGL